MKWYQLLLICGCIYDAQCRGKHHSIAPWQQGLVCLIGAAICFYYGV